MSNDMTTTMDRANKYIFRTYARFPLTLVRGKGCRVWDENGKEYLDFVGGIAVCALGHSSEVVTRALKEQSETLVHVSNLYYTRPQTELAQMLVENSFADKVFFCNSGAEANEAAIKLARRYANEKFGEKRNTILSMVNSFHGRTMATLSATGQSKIQMGYDPLLKGFKFALFNDLENMEKALDDSVCAVIVEPIQGEGGVVCPDPDYLKGVRKLCDERKTLLIFDEVQVGVGRTGRLFAHEHFGVTPDIMTLAKALGNGLPIGAMLATDELAQVFGPGSHASTFGGTPLVTAVSVAVLKSILEDGWLANCRDMGAYMRQCFEGLAEKYGFIKDIRGLGLIIGVELDRPCAPIVDACMHEGILINCAHDTVLRFLPPLIVTRKEIDVLIATLDKVFDQTK
ncbi:Acetylornithine aminotransferase [uncultured Desulfobacterium sp.]|uniref:Acetylornithine aminotransferase n=1 Tax=uncultured Desulfobacterium sp. TaxID=201089 RepID=A0A445MWQ1_9BACT|nr:Acetylornithine aminotransferase [uncultured Desulfobacterium sp.]